MTSIKEKYPYGWDSDEDMIHGESKAKKAKVERPEIIIDREEELNQLIKTLKPGQQVFGEQLTKMKKLASVVVENDRVTRFQNKIINGQCPQCKKQVVNTYGCPHCEGIYIP